MTLTTITTELHDELTVSFLARCQFVDGAMTVQPIDINLFTITNTETGETSNLQCTADELPYKYQPYKSALKGVQLAIAGEFGRVPDSVVVKWG